jgi:prepilin-type N-terminal cleavage/methylation domain-containing protein/prepilin-type processing-associated H-X9-DG protein
MKKTGFTLIELLVVIAIIAILAAILFPVFASAQEKARSMSCLSNAKELATAVNSYVDDNNGTFPKACISYDPSNFWFQAIDKYVKNKRIYICPTLTKNKKQTDYHVGRTGGYNCCYGWNIGVVKWTYNGATYNWNTSGLGYYYGDNVPAVRVSDVPKSSKTIMLGDMSPYKNSGFENYMYLSIDTNSDDLTPSLHNGGGNYAFVDGHAKWISQKDAFSHPELFTRFDD